MAFYGRDYREGYDFGYRPGAWQGGRGSWSGQGDEYRFGRRGRPNSWSDPTWRTELGGGGERFGYRYGADYGTGYDRGYKSRWQTDHGDPFGDRIRHTPMRVIRGDAHDYFGSHRYDRGFGWSPYPISERSFGARSRYDVGYRRPGSHRYDEGVDSWGYAS